MKPLVDPGLSTFITATLASLFGVLLSLMIELFPQLRVWWDTVDDHRKRAMRGWVGLGLTVAIVVFMHFTEVHTMDFTTTSGALFSVLSVLAGWVGFVQSGEATFQTGYAFFARKQ
jgi:L-lactate permease